MISLLWVSITTIMSCFACRTKSSPSTKSVAIIGAGAAGLVSTQILRDDGFRVQVFEELSDVGGVWNYKPGGVMYRSLRTNLPVEIMPFNFIDKFDEEAFKTRSFATHQEIQKYLLDYTEKYDLRQFIKFHHKVTAVYKQSNGGKWVVESKAEGTTDNSLEYSTTKDYRSRETAQHSAQEFDAVVICNGHYNVPYFPAIPGLQLPSTPPTPSTSPTSYLAHYHSYQYDEIKPLLRDKVVLVVGARSSATDTARELWASEPVTRPCNGESESNGNSNSSSSNCSNNISDRGFARKIYISTRSSRPCTASVPLMEERNGVHIIFLSAITEIVGQGQGRQRVRFSGGEEVDDVDAVLWCTGFQYRFPFLSSEAPATVEDRKRVRPLFLQLFSALDPSLSFLGLPFSVVPFPLFYLQARLVSAVLGGRVSLPETAQRLKWLESFEEQLRASSSFEDKYHFLGGDMKWRYMRELLQLLPFTQNCNQGERGSWESYLDCLQAIYDDVTNHRPAFIGAEDCYRGRKYYLISNPSPLNVNGELSFSWGVSPSPLNHDT